MLVDRRDPDLTVHGVRTLVGRRIAAIALGYEDVDDHDTLRPDPVLVHLPESLTPKREDCAVLAGKSTLITGWSTAALGADALAQDQLRQADAGISVRGASWNPTTSRLAKSCSISTPPTIRYTAFRRAGSSTAITMILHSACRGQALSSFSMSPALVSFAGALASLRDRRFALPPWDQENERPNLLRVLTRIAVGTSSQCELAPPLSSLREGQASAGWRNRLSPSFHVTSTSGPPENKIRPRKPEKAVQQHATLSAA